MVEQPQPTIHFFGRASLTGAWTRQKAVVERLDELADDGRVADVDVTLWDGRVRTPPADEFAHRSVEWFHHFEAWADDEDVSLRPCFEKYERHSTITGETYEDYVFPVICLAVRREGDIDEVVPHYDGESLRTVTDCLDDLAGAPSDDERSDADSIAVTE